MSGSEAERRAQNMPSVREVLGEALEDLQEGGWCQGAYVNEDGQCLTHSLFIVIDRAMSWRSGGRLLFIRCSRAIAQQTGMPNLALWNDHPSRTFSQVSEVLRRAIAEQVLAEERAAA